MLNRSRKYPKRALVTGVATVLTVAALQASATAQPSAAAQTSAKQERAGSSNAVAVAPKVRTKVRKSLTITKDGTVVDGALVKGSITIKADNVTIKNTTVKFAGEHSIRIFSRADGTKIRRTKIKCQAPRTNGIAFGNYVARRVSINNCRNDFMSSAKNPAKVVRSRIDGVPFEIRGSTPAAAAAAAAAAAPAPAPTTTPEPEPEPTPVASERASASNTGVPAGTALSAAGTMTITQDGTVLDALHIRGTVTISADNVTIRNSLIQSNTSLYPIRVTRGATGALIEDVEVDNMGGTGIGIFFNGGSGTVRRANVHSSEDGIRIEGNDVTVEGSYVHDLHRQAGGHHDSVQIRTGDNITLEGNTFLPYIASTDDPMNAALQIGSLLGSDQISNLRVIGNYMNGGNFTINGGGRQEVDSAVYSGNRFGRDSRYGVSGNVQNSVWDATNVWDDTGVSTR